MIDIPSMIIGTTLNNKGGGSFSSPAIWEVGFFGRDEMASAASITVTIDGYNGKYALIAVGHRADLTAPEGCTLLDKSTFESKGITQYVSVYKHQIASASESLVFTQASSTRIAATVWVLDADYSLTKVDTKTEATNIYTTPVEVTTKELSFLTFSAIFAQQSISNREWAFSNGAWLCADDYEGSRYIEHYYCRFFTGIVPACNSEHTILVGKKTDNTGMISVGEGAQIVIYNISVT